MISKFSLKLALLAVALMGANQAWSYTNPPVPNSSGVSGGICDIRSHADSGAKTLRNRLESYFNQNIDCYKLIYFLDPGTVTLNSPLTIEGYQRDGKGTIISGRNEAGNPMGVTINAVDITKTGNNCAFMITGGLSSFQQIHGVTILVSDPKKAICDEDGDDLMDVEIPNTTKRGLCSAGDLARECDFKQVEVLVPPGAVGPAPCADQDGDDLCDSVDLCDNEDGPASNSGCPNTKCISQVDGQPKTKQNMDEDGDLIDKACDANDAPPTPVCPDPDNDDVCNDGRDACPNDAGTAAFQGCPDSDGDGVPDPEDDCENTPAGAQVNAAGCPDSDGDGKADTDDLCDEGSTGNKCDSTNLAACFDNAADDVCSTLEIPCGETTRDDQDGDGFGDRCDDDIDGDGLKNGSDPDPRQGDADYDNVCDGSIVVPNNDCTAGPDECPLDNKWSKVNSKGICGDEIPETVDQDPDGDGVTTKGEDKNQNGAYDADSETDPANADTDGDGFSDGMDCFPLDVAKQACGGTIIVTDADFDNDGICDQAITVEAEDDPEGIGCTPNAQGAGDNCPAVSNPDQKDLNGNGVGDDCEVNPDIDGDGDSLPDNLEDGVVFCTSSESNDSDGDGLTDSDEVNGMTFQGGLGPCDPDVDDDLICDGPTSVAEKDADGNTVKDEDGNDVMICTTNANGEADNCPVLYNPEQEDSEGDKIGDLCQGDMDGDGVPDVDPDDSEKSDNCAFVANKDQNDSDEDGIGDACDPDFDQSSIAGGCGCRVDGKTTGKATDTIPFLAMALPMLMFRILRRSKKMLS